MTFKFRVKFRFHIYISFFSLEKRERKQHKIQYFEQEAVVTRICRNEYKWIKRKVMIIKTLIFRPIETQRENNIRGKIIFMDAELFIGNSR